jgi:hypothetical protein
MSHTPVTGEPGARATAVEWPQVVELMRTRAAAVNDEWISALADAVDVGVFDHWYGWSFGCEVCNPRLEQAGPIALWACPRWTHAQSIALTWLAEQAGLR